VLIHVAPFPRSTDPITQVFHFITGAPPFALIVIVPSFCPSAIVTTPGVPMPGGP
jgi:hypothetical protein